MHARLILRRVTSSPLAFLATFLTLALGIGVGATVFSIWRQVLQKPVPGLEDVFIVYEDRLGTQELASGPNFNDWNEKADVFKRLAAFRRQTPVLNGDSGNYRLAALEVTSDFLPLLGTRPGMGRSFVPEDFHGKGAQVAIVSAPFWKKHYPAERNPVGLTIRVDNRPVSIIGMLRADFYFPYHTGVEMLLPRQLDESPSQSRQRREFVVLAQLREGLRRSTAQTRLDLLSAHLVETYPISNEEMRAVLVPVLEDITREQWPMLTALFVAGTCVLVLCLLNITNIVLANLSSRGSEFLVRRALGGGAWRLLYQLAAENLLLFGIGCPAGLLLAGVLLNLFVVNGGSLVPRSRLPEISLDFQVAVYCAAAAIITAVIWTVVSAARVGAWKPWIGNRLASFQKPGRVRASLVAVQIGVSFGLLVGASLLLNSYVRLIATDLGFDDEQVLYAQISMPASSDRSRQMGALSEQLRGRLSRVPRVDSVAASDWAPLFRAFQLVEVKATGLDQALKVNVRRVSPGYFRALDVPLTNGRELEDDDLNRGEDVVVVDELLARKLWPSDSAVGKRIEFRYPKLHRSRIVGVARPVRQTDIRMPEEPMMYVPYSAMPSISLFLIVKARDMQPQELLSILQSEAAAINRDAVVEHLDWLEGWTGRTLNAPKLYALLLGLFATVGMILTGIGSYGVTRLSVTANLKELAIRAALGADVARLRRQATRQSLLPACVGIVLGATAVLWWRNALSAVLFQIKATDPWTLCGAAFLILGIVVFSAYRATRRLRSLQPSSLLRSQ